MDLFAAIMLRIVAVIVVVVVALGIWYPGSGAAQVGWRTPRDHAEQEAALDSEDLEQMLEAANARRRARGDPELTVDGLLAQERAAGSEPPGRAG
jgi:hypothetical protein